MPTVTSTAPVSLLARRPDAAFGRFMFWSALLHAVLFALAVVYAVVNEAPAIDLNQTPIKATLVRQGKERDEKLLPRIEEPPPPPPESKAPEPVAPPEPPKVAAPAPAPTPAPPKPKQPGEKQADSRQKLFGAFDKMNKSKPSELSGAADGDLRAIRPRPRARPTTPGCRARSKRFYDVSQTIPDAERIRLVAQVALFITPSGQLERARLARASGNDLFDAAVLAAVKRAAPFSPPPSHLRDPLQKYGVVLQFRP